MREVETNGILVDELTGLLNMVAEHGAQCSLQEVSCRVVAHDCSASLNIYNSLNGVAFAEEAFLHNSLVDKHTRCILRGIQNADGAGIVRDDAGIADLTAAFRIERGAVECEHDVVAGLDSFNACAIFHDSRDLCGCLHTGVADKFGLGNVVKHIGIACPCVCTGILAACTSRLTLLEYQCAEAVFVNAHAFFGKDFLGQVNREAERIAEQERVFAGKHLCIGAVDDVVEQREALINGLIEVFFLKRDDLFDHSALFTQLRVSAFVLVNDGIYNVREERVVDAEKSAMACRAAEQTAEHIAAAFVGRHNTIADHKRRAADVVRNDAQRNIGLFVCTVLHICNAGDMLHDVLHGIDKE